MECERHALGEKLCIALMVTKALGLCKPPWVEFFDVIPHYSTKWETLP
jgi:hypothetical protein